MSLGAHQNLAGLSEEHRIETHEDWQYRPLEAASSKLFSLRRSFFLLRGFSLLWQVFPVFLADQKTENPNSI